MDTWYTAGQRRVHGHVVQSWTKKQDLPIVPAERAYAETCHVNGLDGFFGFDSTIYCYPRRQ